MKCNIGHTDRLIRAVAAVIAASIANMNNVWWLYLFAAVFAVEALVAYCPLYALLGINTREK